MSLAGGDDTVSMTVEVQPVTPLRRRAPRQGPATDHPSTRPSLTRAVACWLQEHALLVTAVAAVLVLSLEGIPGHLAQDGWLALVAGRIIAHSGIPHRDYLTVMAHGVRWTDQQWLAQLVIYELWRIGGPQLMCVLYVLMTSGAFAGTLAISRRLGAEERTILWVLPLGAFFYLVTAEAIRTQGFAYPLFVATLGLLAAEVRQRHRLRVYLVLPILLLWANLHGSATMGAGLAGLYGLLELIGAVRARGIRGLLDTRGLVFTIGSPLTLLATPYGLAIIRYYRITLLNSSFSKLVTEWQPVTSYMILAVPLLALIGACIWLLGRSGRRTPTFDHLVLAILAFGAIDAVRNITWFGLAVVMLLPPTITRLTRAGGRAPRRRRLNMALACASLVMVALAVLVTLGRPNRWFERTYPPRAVAIAARLVRLNPRTRIFADVRYADWLVWNDPRLAGHIAYDTSLENLTTRQLTGITDLLEERGPGVPDTLGPYDVLMLYPVNHAENRVLLAQRGVHVIYRSAKVVIATKPFG
jgi:alkylhydroperoxidase family enzyme